MSLYDEYCSLVADLCNTAMEQDSSWRDRYYAAYIDEILAVNLEQENKKRKSLKPLGKSPSPIDVNLANSGRKRRSLTGPSSANAETGIATSSSLPSTATSSGFDSPLCSCDRNSTSWATPQSSPETSSFSIPHSPISPCTPFGTLATVTSMAIVSPCTPPPPTAPSTSSCANCGATFTGSHQHRTSNLRRHERTMHRRRSKLVCPQEGCGVEFSRSDNLRKHRKTAHGLEEPLDKKSKRMARKPSDLKEITTWI